MGAVPGRVLGKGGILAGNPDGSPGGGGTAGAKGAIGARGAIPDALREIVDDAGGEDGVRIGGKGARGGIFWLDMGLS